MKKFAYILSGIVLLTVASCRKDQIQPISTEEGQVPILKSAKAGEGVISSDDSQQGITSTTVVPITKGTDNGITDPNNDKDENSRRTRN